MKLRDVLNIYDFDYYDKVDNVSCNAAINYNSRTVRVYTGESLYEPFFEVGMSCYLGNGDRIHVADFIRKDILERKVCKIQASDDMGILFVFLKGNGDED